MDLKVDKWQSTSGVLFTPPVKFQYVNIPYSSGNASLGYVTSLSGYTTANTGQIYSFTYTPALATSTIMWMFICDMDASSNGSQKHLCVFVDGVCYSNGYLYARNSGNEPQQFNQSGSYTNSSTTAKTFSIRTGSGGNWTNYLGQSINQGNPMANAILIFEYPR